MKFYFFPLYIFLFFSCQNRELSPTPVNKNKVTSKTKTRVTSTIEAQKPKINSNKILTSIKSSKKQSSIQKNNMDKQYTISKDPLKKAKIYIKLGYGAYALDMLDKLKGYENNISYRKLQIKAAYLTYKLHEALFFLKKAEKIAKKTDDLYFIYLYIGKINAKFRKYQKALEYLNKATILQPKNQLAWIELIQILIKLKQTKHLRKVFNQLKQNHNLTPLLLFQYADYYCKIYQNKKALNVLEQIYSNLNLKVFMRAKALDKMGIILSRYNRRKALEVLRQCKKEFPSYGCAYTEIKLYPKYLPKSTYEEIKRSTNYGTVK